MNSANTYLSSKPRYEILDGLRGVAAIVVVAFHLFETYSPGVPYQIINHGYLAVDFFFALSGYVIGYAYDDRWDRMTVWSFIKRRLIRLHPMLVFGTLFGAALYYFGGDYPGFDIIGRTPWWKVAACMALCLLMIPVPRALEIRGWGEMNPLNGATWSLFWEYLANLIYALFVRRFSKAVLGCCVAIFAAATVVLCMDIDPFGVLAARSAAAYTVIGGWEISAAQIQIGLTRLLYPFFCGLLLSRIGSKVSLAGGFWWCSLLVVAALAMPRIGGDNPDFFWMNGLYEAACILLLFPLVIVIGAGSRVSGRRSAAVCKFLGDISYPLYVTHYPLIYVQMSWAATHGDLPASTHLFVAAAIFCLAMFVAWASLKSYDEPVREWLKEKLFGKKSGHGKE